MMTPVINAGWPKLTPAGGRAGPSARSSTSKLACSRPTTRRGTCASPTRSNRTLFAPKPACAVDSRRRIAYGRNPSPAVCNHEPSFCVIFPVCPNVFRKFAVFARRGKTPGIDVERSSLASGERRRPACRLGRLAQAIRRTRHVSGETPDTAGGTPALPGPGRSSTK